MTTKNCEFEIIHRSKPDLELQDKCSLTGKTCFCPDTPLTCTRRTFALAYEEKRQGRQRETETRITSQN